MYSAYFYCLLIVGLLESVEELTKKLTPKKSEKKLAAKGTPPSKGFKYNMLVCL